MRLRKSLPLLAVLALLAGLTLPTAAPAGSAEKAGSSAKKAGSGKKGSCKQGSGRKNSGGKKQMKKGKKKGGCAKESEERPGMVGAAAPECSSSVSECFLDIWLYQGAVTSGAFCDSFDRGSGLCVGYSTGTPGWHMSGYAPKYGIQSSFTWESQGGPSRTVDFTANATYTIVEAYIRGNVPASNSAVFNVTDAYNRLSNTHWKTASTGSNPGLPGGPLYIDYGHKTIGSYVHIFGYLVRK